MRRILISVVVFLCLLQGCCPKLYQQIEKEEYSRDTIIKERLVRDTVFYEIPAEKEEIVTKDSVSNLENRYAESHAEVKGGLLYHTLLTKQQSIKIPHVTPITETTISSNVLRVVVREVERKVTIWESFQMVLGRIFLFILAIGIICLAVNKFRR